MAFFIGVSQRLLLQVFTFVLMTPIGIFDSGYGGLTVMKEIKKLLPQYDYLYLGDNARSPYGNRSYETVYEYTKQCVKWMLDKGCPLVILACNTASAKALRTIQQRDLQRWGVDKRILGVIRPTAEVVGDYSKTQTIGILATAGTVNSGSYLLEIEKFFPGMKVIQQACPLWVPIIENNLINTPGAACFFQHDVNSLFGRSDNIDTVLLGCTHYPLVAHKIEQYMPSGVTVLSQGRITADSLASYLKRHPDMEARLSQSSNVQFFTTDSVVDFDTHSAMFFGEVVHSVHVNLA